MKRPFTRNLLKWHYTYNKRIMPWKQVIDPYKIWLSEIILQQTRVEQGLPYYNAFIKQFPTIQTLAQANDEVVYKLWEGLGYYTRCKNLLHTARAIADKRQGVFPDKYEEILSLKGVGPYTAAAISSFAYGLPKAVVDGNVFRVLSRYFNIIEPIDSPVGKKAFALLAQELLCKEDAGGYNQAIMDFGATVCKPKIPLCQACILKPGCAAYKKGTVSQLPVKSKKLLRKHRWFYYFVFSVNKQLLVNKRKEKDIWQNLHEFFLYETNKKYRWDKLNIHSWLQEQLDISRYSLTGISAGCMQQLTHQVICGQFIHIDLPLIPKSLRHLKVIDNNEVKSLSFPKFINQYLHTVNI